MLKNWQDLVWQVLIGLLVVFIGGWMLGGVINFAAMASPQLVSAVFCPAGAAATWEPAGEQGGSRLACHDPDGTFEPPLTDAESVALQRKYFYMPSYFVMGILAVGWYVRAEVRKRR